MRPIVVKVGPLAAASANNIATSQTGAAGKNLALNGAIATGFVANNIALSQTVASATTVVLNGATVQSDALAHFAQAQPVAITSAGNDSGITFTVVGTGPNNYASQTTVITGANAGVASSALFFFSVTSITTSGATAAAITIGTNGYVATLDMPRRLIITSAGNDSGMNFAITGTDWNGNQATETLTGGNAAAVQSLYDYSTVTSIVASAATASTVTVGTNGVASSRPVRLDSYAPSPTAFQVSVTGTINYTVQQSLDLPAAVPYSSVVWVNSADAAVVAATATAQSSYTYAPVTSRLLVNSGTGTATMTIHQLGGPEL